MGSKKKVVLPTAAQLEVVLDFLKENILEDDTDFEDAGDGPYGYAHDGNYVLVENSKANKVLIDYLESLHPPVYKTKSVKEKVGRLGLK